jgi:hypothetical protein
MTRSLIAMAAFAAAGCTGTTSSQTQTAPVASNTVACAGEPYLEVNNPTQSGLDVYAYVDNGTGVFVATANPGFTRVTLRGTPIENKYGTLYAMQGGRVVTSAGVPNANFIMTRRCDRGVQETPPAI